MGCWVSKWGKGCVELISESIFGKYSKINILVFKFTICIIKYYWEKKKEGCFMPNTDPVLQSKYSKKRFDQLQKDTDSGPAVKKSQNPKHKYAME